MFRLLLLQPLSKGPQIWFDLKIVPNIYFISNPLLARHILGPWEVQVQMETIDVVIGKMTVGVTVATFYLPLFWRVHLVYASELERALSHRFDLLDVFLIGFLYFLKWMFRVGRILWTLARAGKIIVVLFDLINSFDDISFAFLSQLLTIVCMFLFTLFDQLLKLSYFLLVDLKLRIGEDVLLI